MVIIVGAVVISIPTSGLGSHVWLGNLLIGLGYAAWATENNLGRLLSEDTPAVTLVCLKALVAGMIMGIFWQSSKGRRSPSRHGLGWALSPAAVFLSDCP